MSPCRLPGDCHHPNVSFCSHRCCLQALGTDREQLGDSSAMAPACLFVCPRGKLRSLPQGWPAAGLGTRGSADLMNFYATTSAVAHGHPHFRPRLGHHTGTGFVSNECSAVRSLLCPRGAAEGHRQDTAASTTAEHFKPLWVPDGRSLLPRRVHLPESGYLQHSPLTCLRAGAEGPQNVWSLQDPPKAPGEHGTESRRTAPAYPDILQKSTIGAKELSGFSKAAPRTHRVLPALPGQPLGVSVTTTDFQPSVRSHGGETLPTLPVGSERGSGFTREVPGCLGASVSPHLVSRWRGPRGTQASLLGQQRIGRKELSGFTINHGQYVTPRPSPAAPAQHWGGPTWTARPLGGIQPQRPSGFSTNNPPTRLGDSTGHPPACSPRGGPR